MPRPALSGSLGVISPYLPAELLADDARSRLLEAASRIPAAVTRWSYIECRLTRRDTRVDLIVSIERDGAEALLRAARRGLLSELGLDDPVWRRILEMVGLWLREARLRRAVEALWIEIDLPDDASRGVAKPRVFLAFERSWLAATAPEIVVGCALRLLRCAHGTDAVPASAIAVLGSALHALPPGLCLGYLGCDPSSPTAPLRLCVMSLPDAPLGEYLDGLGWPGLFGDDPLLQGAWVSSRPRMAHVDVGERPLPGVGLEIVLDRHAQLGGWIREVPLLRELVGRGLCTPEKAAALQRWPGRSLAVMPHEFWPSLVTRRVNNLKLRIETGRVTEAKGYLCFHHERRLRSS